MIRKLLARRRLQQLVTERANSVEVINYRRNRQAQIQRRSKTEAGIPAKSADLISRRGV